MVTCDSAAGEFGEESGLTYLSAEPCHFGMFPVRRSREEFIPYTSGMKFQPYPWNGPKLRLEA